MEILVNLVDWDEKYAYERLGLEDNKVVILGVEVPEVFIPLFPGKNITVLAETIAIDYLLRLDGEYAARSFSQRLQERIKAGKKTMMTLGVAGHAREVAVHRAALQECRDIQLVYDADCAAVLKEKVDGLVLLHVADKSHWIGTALAAGLPVMATHPVPEFADSRPV